MQAITILEKEFGIIAEFDAEDLLTSGIQVENLLTSYLLQFRDVVSNNYSKLAFLQCFNTVGSHLIIHLYCIIYIYIHILYNLQLNCSPKKSS